MEFVRNAAKKNNKGSKGILSLEKVIFGIHKYEEIKEGTYEE